jgi:hypothetical protein
MEAIRMMAVALALVTAACSKDSGEDGGAHCNSDHAEMTASPTASPATSAPGATVTITVPVNGNAVRVHAQLLSAVDALGYGDGMFAASGAGNVAVQVPIDAAAPPGRLYPFVQVYECLDPILGTQYAPSLTDGTYTRNRPIGGGGTSPTSFVAPAITVQ